MADLSSYLKNQYASALESELASLESAYKKNSSSLENAYKQSNAMLDRTAETIPQEYSAQRNTVAATNALEKQAFDERANAMGLNTGASGQAQLARSSMYQRDLANIGTAEANALADLALQRSQQKAEYENSVAQRQAEYEMALAQARARNNELLNAALYQEMVRQANLAPPEVVVETESSSGGGGGGYSGYNNGSLSTSEVKRMQQYINSGLPANQQIAVDGKWGAETTAAAGASANDFAREYYKQNSWSGRSDR